MGRKTTKKVEAALEDLNQAIVVGDREGIEDWYLRNEGSIVRSRGWSALSQACLEGQEVCEEAFGELASTYEELVFLYEVAPKLGSILNPARLCRAAVTEIMQTIPVQGAYIVGREKRRAIKLASKGPYPYKGDLLWRETIEASFTMVDSPKMLDDFPDGSLPEAFRPRGMKVHSVLSCPMRVRGRVLGAITLYNREGASSFSAADGKRLHALASQAAVALYNGRLVAQLRETEQLRRELEIARGIQESLLPEELVTVEGISVDGRCRMATEVGGDYYDAFPVKNGGLAVLVADGMGHGLGAAMVMASFRTILRTVCREESRPSQILQKVNKLLSIEYEKATTFVSCFYGVLDPESGVFLCANGGHNYPLVRRKDGSIEEVVADGPLLGVFPGASFSDTTVSLGSGDSLLLYTDGLIECTDKKKVQFGYQRLHRVFARWGGHTPSRALDRVFTTVDRFRERAAQRDDMTGLVVFRD